ncbi:NAD(P)-dependent oxidoreductase [Cognaticolwellia beringensis]|uniref:NAD(P)-dependent oxidoreductase n=2 Tax=Cognaticolwellia beringensis TaxID=1967665 RepID=A0A222G5L7_9GAMM|nr:NAD(P)-dependent oxidoreductase [Cognaticolwellia beringensis]ASP47195.1 NAD(P)-dependent oxidoreductase [Cognaticolwellia beringensis]|tara:strand:- start:2291 stop:3154 length:864 start_codon:yes stop_codon:yes gene_type:complete
MKVAFIGLGVMGYPMAGHLQKAGHEVCVFNRSQAKADKWQAEFSGTSAKTPALAAKDCEIVFCCVGNDDDLRQVVLGENGILAGMPKGSILVDHTTASAEVAVELAGIAASQEQYFLDAPVSGGQAGAENGVLTVMVGGDETIFNKAEPVMAAFARFSQLMGPVGSGQLAKMVNQICFVNTVQGLAEGLNFAQKAGLNIDKLLDTIGKGAAGSWQMDNRGKTMCAREFDFGFAVDWVRKDLAIAFAEAEKLGADLTVTKQLDGYYKEIQENGGNRWDTSSLISRFKK